MNYYGYETSSYDNASWTVRKRFGAVWGQVEGLQDQCYAIPVDYGKYVRKDGEVKATVGRTVLNIKRWGYCWGRLHRQESRKSKTISSFIA